MAKAEVRGVDQYTSRCVTIDTDGSVVTVEADDTVGLTPTQARYAAKLLRDAADEIDRNTPGNIMSRPVTDG